MEKEIGSETKLTAEMLNGKIKLSVVYDGAQVDGSATIMTDADLLVDALAKLIPGDSAIEQGVAALFKAALKAVVV